MIQRRAEDYERTMPEGLTATRHSPRDLLDLAMGNPLAFVDGLFLFSLQVLWMLETASKFRNALVSNR